MVAGSVGEEVEDLRRHGLWLLELQEVPGTLDDRHPRPLWGHGEGVADGIEAEAPVVLPVEVEGGDRRRKAEGVLGFAQGWVMEYPRAAVSRAGSPRAARTKSTSSPAG